MEDKIVIQTFGVWEDDIHNNTDQLSRLSTARLEKTTPAFVDVHTESAIYEGSGKKPYTTTLNTCSCGDFINRRLPCKHIYRLAIELGKIECDYKNGRNKNNILKYISLLSPTARKLLLDLLETDRHVFDNDLFAVELIVNGFCYQNIDDTTDQNTINISALPEIENNRYAVLKELRGEIRQDEMVQLTLDDLDKPADEDKKEYSFSLSGVVGCCSNYRDCSTTGICAHQDDDQFKNCAYLQNLKSGKVFYTEKASTYDINRYCYLSDVYNIVIPEHQREIFEDIVNYFCAVKRGATRCLCLYDENVYDILNKCSAFDIATGDQLINYLFSSSILLLKNSQKLYEKATNKKFPNIDLSGIPTKAQKDHKLNETQKILINTPEVYDIIMKKYILFSISTFSFEIEELFHTFDADTKTRGISSFVYLDRRQTENTTNIILLNKFKDALK